MEKEKKVGNAYGAEGNGTKREGMEPAAGEPCQTHGRNVKEKKKKEVLDCREDSSNLIISRKKRGKKGSYGRPSLFDSEESGVNFATLLFGRAHGAEKPKFEEGL